MKMPLSVYNKKTAQFHCDLKKDSFNTEGSDSDRNFSDIIFTFIKI